MDITIKPADIENGAELDRLVETDRLIFGGNDAFASEDWKDYLAFWVVSHRREIGSFAFRLNMACGSSYDQDTYRAGSLYVVSTGLVQGMQGRGIGTAVKRWQIEWARLHNFTTISTNCRESNQASAHLNQKCGFRLVRIVPDYYSHPVERAMEFELKLIS